MESFFKSVSLKKYLKNKYSFLFVFRNYNFGILLQTCFTKIYFQKKYSCFFFGTIIYNVFSRHRHVANTLSPFWAQFGWKKHCFVLARKHLEEGFQNYCSKKKTIFFLEVYFGETLLKKDSKTIVPIFLFCFELFFGETLLKKKQIIVPKKRNYIIFGIIFW